MDWGRSGQTRILTLPSPWKQRRGIRAGRLTLIWSYILDYENNKNPFPERRGQIEKWRQSAHVDVEEGGNVLRIARTIGKTGIKKIDSLHVACAISAKANYFLTTDDGILMKAGLVKEIKINDPFGFIKEALI